jgi:phospholipid/cholesterol/gamma-HCH transport system ATP-binding protein
MARFLVQNPYVDRIAGAPALAKRMVRYAHFRGIVKGGPVFVNENGSGCLLQIKGVTLHFGAKMIFNDLSLEIRRGECLVLLGPSGIGKSTLLRLLIKTLNPERGSILFHGADITHLPRAQLNRIRTRIGMVFQSSALVSSMCVSENLALPLRELTTKTEREIATIVEEKLHFVGLENAKDLMPSQLSGGMKKRIAVARALVLNPDLILFDEPTTGLDPVAARQVSELIVDLNRKTGATILVVTHDLHSTFLIATRIAVLDQGRIIEEGPPEAIRHSHDPVVAQFLAAGASDGAEADFTRDRHQLTRDEIGSSQMSKDELIRQLSIALSDAREVIKCAVPRSETSDCWQRDARLLEVAKESFVRSLEENKAGIPLGDARGRRSLSVRTPRSHDNAE